MQSARSIAKHHGVSRSITEHRGAHRLPVRVTDHLDCADYADRSGMLPSEAEWRGVPWRAAEYVEYVDNGDGHGVMWSAGQRPGVPCITRIT